MIRFLDKICPYLAARIVNNKISNDIKQINQADIEKKWICKLQSSNLDEQILEKISNDIYQSQERLITNIENKAISLIVAIGFFISLLGIIIGFAESSINDIRLIALIIFIIAIFLLLLAAISAFHAYRLRERNVVALNELSDILSSKDNKIVKWASKYLSTLEINYKIGIMKSNWVDVSQRYIISGLAVMSIATVVIILELACVSMWVEKIF